MPSATKEASLIATHVHEHRRIFVKYDCRVCPKLRQYYLRSAWLTTPIITFCLTISMNLNVFNIIVFHFWLVCPFFRGGGCIHLAWARLIATHVHEHRRIFVKYDCRVCPKLRQYYLRSAWLTTPIITFCLTISMNLNVFNIIVFHFWLVCPFFRGGGCIHLAWARQINGYQNINEIYSTKFNLIFIEKCQGQWISSDFWNKLLSFSFSSYQGFRLLHIIAGLNILNCILQCIVLDNYTCCCP